MSVHADRNVCPYEVAEAVLSILFDAILDIRSSDDADWSSTEANHIHNLPLLLRRFDRSALEGYFEWSVGRYIGEFYERSGRIPTAYLSEWYTLADYLARSAQEPETKWREVAESLRRLETEPDYRQSYEQKLKENRKNKS